MKMNATNNRFYRGETMKTKAPKSEAQKVAEFENKFLGKPRPETAAVQDYQFRRVSECLVILTTPNTEHRGALVVTESHIGHGLSIGTAKRLLAELGKALNGKH